MPRKLDLRVHLRPVERARRDESALVADREHIRCEAESLLGRHGGSEAHRVDREAEEDDVEVALREDLLHRLLVDVVFELLLLDRDGEDLVDPVDVGRVRESGGILRDDRDADRPAQLLGRRHQLQRDRAELSPELLGYEEDAHFIRSWTISLIRCATAAAPPFIISAPSPLGGRNIFSTRYDGSPRSPGWRTSISFSSACLIARSVA